MKEMKLDIDLGNKSSGQIKTTCPLCSPTRGNPKDKSFSLNIDSGFFKCHHCGEEGNVYENSDNGGVSKPITLAEFFTRRGISKTTLDKMKVTMDGKWIRFPYVQDGKQVNTKSRSFNKEFIFEKGGKIVPYNIDSIKDATELIITEGEIDALTFIECGFKSVISVPTGANTNLKYLEGNDFSHINKFYIATDDDEKGRELADALYKYFGLDNCVTVKYKGRKDINELFCVHGKQFVKDAIQQAKNPNLDPFLKRLEERHFTIDTPFEDDIPILYFGGKKALSLGNFSVITGKQKAGKGFTLSLMVDGFLNGNPQHDVIGSSYADRKRVVHIDTEQAGGHAQRLVRTVKKLGGNADLIDAYWLRGYSPNEIILATDQLIRKYSGEACLFIIDGIRDLSNKGVNDQEESTVIYIKLLNWTKDYNIHIVVVIHQNKQDGNATGFLGGDMVKKGELTLAITKDKKTITHKIDPEDTRDAPLEPIFFEINETVTPVIIDSPKPKNKKDGPEDFEMDTHRATVKNVFVDGKGLTAKELVDKIMYQFRVGANKAGVFKEFWMDKKLIKDTGSGQKRNYVLNEEPKLQL
jgi:twinkle protein